MPKQYVHQFDDYQTAVKVLTPDLPQPDYAQLKEQPAKTLKDLKKDVFRTEIFVPDDAATDYLQRYEKQFYRPFDYAQGDPTGCASARFALSDYDHAALSTSVFVPALHSIDDHMHTSQIIQNQMQCFGASYLNDAGHIEGFTLIINRQEPKRYFVTHGINMAGKRAINAAQNTDELFTIKCYYSTACEGIEGEHSRAKLSTNASNNEFLG